MLNGLELLLIFFAVFPITEPHSMDITYQYILYASLQGLFACGLSECICDGLNLFSMNKSVAAIFRVNPRFYTTSAMWNLGINKGYSKA